MSSRKNREKKGSKVERSLTKEQIDQLPIIADAQGISKRLPNSTSPPNTRSTKFSTKQPSVGSSQIGTSAISTANSKPDEHTAQQILEVTSSASSSGRKSSPPPLSIIPELVNDPSTTQTIVKPPPNTHRLKFSDPDSFSNPVPIDLTPGSTLLAKLSPKQEVPPDTSSIVEKSSPKVVKVGSLETVPEVIPVCEAALVKGEGEMEPGTSSSIDKQASGAPKGKLSPLFNSQAAATSEILDHEQYLSSTTPPQFKPSATIFNYPSARRPQSQEISPQTVSKAILSKGHSLESPPQPSELISKPKPTTPFTTATEKIPAMEQSKIVRMPRELMNKPLPIPKVTTSSPVLTKRQTKEHASSPHKLYTPIEPIDHAKERPSAHIPLPLDSPNETSKGWHETPEILAFEAYAESRTLHPTCEHLVKLARAALEANSVEFLYQNNKLKATESRVLSLEFRIAYLKKQNSALLHLSRQSSRFLKSDLESSMEDPALSLDTVELYTPDEQTWDFESDRMRMESIKDNVRKLQQDKRDLERR